MFDYYNIQQINRIYLAEECISDKWKHYPINSVKGIINWIFRNKLYSLNRNSDVYRPSKYFMHSETIPYYTEDDIKEHLDSFEYYDPITKEIKVYPKVVLKLSDGTKTEIGFKTNVGAKEYAKALVEKYDNYFFSFNKD